MCDERDSLSNLHRTLQENMHTINMRTKSCDHLRQSTTPKDHNDLLQFYIDLSLISTDKEEKLKKLENVRKDINHSIQLFNEILELQNNRNQNSLLDAEIVRSVLQRDGAKSKETKLFEDLTQKNLYSIVERLEIAKTRLLDVAHKDGLELRSYKETNVEENKNQLNTMKKELFLIEKALKEKKKSMEELKVVISGKTRERDHLKREIRRWENVDLMKKLKSLHTQVVVHYDITSGIEYSKTPVKWDDNSNKEVFVLYKN